jgi:hypothetical protein
VRGPGRRPEARRGNGLGALSAELEGRGLTNRGDAKWGTEGAGRSLEWTLRKQNPWLLAELHALDPEWASFIANFDQADGSTPLPSRRGQWPYDLCADPRRADAGCLDGETQRGVQGESPGLLVRPGKLTPAR